ncbi:hypothetical protein TTHERM_00463470 (macronuclear) [Tetrahymena thermophila SB210]|uniref:Jacalin-type lectin domain-containing protein n=1 Tax=Tetrahymena thermophila (strain SB210) TaxID=312017 RepID=Q23PT6_TETTS|nr:hypothetical protein TTHERM_00463470 [Tetrahymena thermophila SB210]EAR98599.2 hypothetical protein TTHERM_00463470 [Tetrahymena thermophila SB210]|eukprot:XP_001018844.2 hypothetical protein TTHERM_00463470 [Tetrahymena thermophila SB210]
MTDTIKNGYQQPLFRRRSISKDQKPYGSSSLPRQQQYTLDSTENDIKGEQKSIEYEKRIKDNEISKLIQEKDHYMKNAIESNNKLKEMRKSRLNDTMEENDQLKNQIKDQRQREQELETLVKNQKEQIKELEKRYQYLQKIKDPYEPPAVDMNHQGIETNQEQQDFQNPSSTVPIFKNKYPAHSLASTGVTYKYLSNKKNLPQHSSTYTSPFKKPLYPHQNDSVADVLDSEPQRNYETPREKYRKKKINYRSSDPHNPVLDNKSYQFPKNGQINTQITQNEYSPSRANVQNVNFLNPDDVQPDSELDNASREELLHAVKLLKKQLQAQERKHKNELDAMTIRTQRAEMDGTDLSNNRYRDAKIRDLENKLRDREKELEMVYMKMKNNQNENIPLSSNASNRRPLQLESLQPKENFSNSAQPSRKSNGSQNIVIPARYDLETRQDVRNQIGNGLQNADEDLIKTTTHGKLKRITVWSNNERIHGITFSYLKHDGSLFEPNVNIFASKNLRADFMDFDVEDDNDYVEEIQGKYNIKGVKDLIITSPTGKSKHFKPIGVDKSRDQEFSDLDEVFTVKYDYVEKPLKVVFPNVFYYDMKGARLYDKHDQNFYYMESTRCISLSNPNLVYIAGLPAIRMPLKQDPNDELLSNAPMTNHYYSDNADVSRLKEIKEDGFGKINWTDAELIFFEKKVKIYKMSVYADNEYIYGFQFQYLTPDGYQLIVGKKHVGIQHLDKPVKEFSFDTPELQLSKIYIYRTRADIIQKLIIITSDSKRTEFGKIVTDKDAKEILLELKPTSYLYGCFINHPLSRTPGDIILSNLRVAEIKPYY